MKNCFVAMPFLVVFLAQSVHAEPAPGLDKLLLLSMEDLLSLKVKISTNTDQTLSKAPSVVTVITAEDIRLTGATNLRDVLQGVPGVYVRSNLFGFRPQVTFRGAAAAHTLLMVDGVPMRDQVWTAGIFAKGLPTNMIDRVEIIRGPGSALFGSDASAGVINVITKSAGRIEQSEAGLRAGSFDTQAGWLQHGGSWNGFDIGITAELAHTEGYNPFITVDGQTSRDQRFGTQVSYAPGHVGYGWNNQDIRFSIAKENWRLLASYMAHLDVETGLSGAGVLDPLTEGNDQRFDAAVLYNNEAFAPNWNLNAEFRFYHLDYTSGNGFQERPPGYTDATGTYPDGLLNRMSSAERGLSLDVGGVFTGFKKHAIRVGGGHSLKNLYRVEQYVNFGTGADGNTLTAGGPLVNLSDTPYAFAPERIRRISHLYLQDIWAISHDLELTAGARYDYYSDFGGTLNPRVALVWQSTDRLTSKLMFGEAFRAPSYLELYSQTSANLPNPDLTPERSNTWDLSFTYAASKNLKLGLDLYQFKQTNIIGFDAHTQFQNIGNRTSHGIEFEAKWQATKTLRVAGNLTQTEEDDTAFRSYSLPGRKAYLRTDWRFQPNWNWNVQANWIDKRELPLGDPRAPMKAYTLVDTTVRYLHGADWEFAASIRNLFDEDARDYSSSSIPNNLPLPGRSVQAEMMYKF